MTRIVAARPEAVAEARHAVEELPLPKVTREELQLLVSELVTNSVLHAGLSDDDPVSLDISNRPGHARVSVHDGGQGFAAPPLEGRNPLTVGGQGLVIVAALSETWGVERDQDGCTVWCEVAVPAGADEST